VLPFYGAIDVYFYMDQKFRMRLKTFQFRKFPGGDTETPCGRGRPTPPWPTSSTACGKLPG